MATRWRMPPDSSCGWRFSNPESPTRSRYSRALAARSRRGTPAASRPNSILGVVRSVMGSAPALGGGRRGGGRRGLRAVGVERVGVQLGRRDLALVDVTAFAEPVDPQLELLVGDASAGLGDREGLPV